MDINILDATKTETVEVVTYVERPVVLSSVTITPGQYRAYGNDQVHIQVRGDSPLAQNRPYGTSVTVPGTVKRGDGGYLSSLAGTDAVYRAGVVVSYKDKHQFLTQDNETLDILNQDILSN